MCCVCYKVYLRQCCSYDGLQNATFKYVCSMSLVQQLNGIKLSVNTDKPNKA